MAKHRGPRRQGREKSSGAGEKSGGPGAAVQNPTWAPGGIQASGRQTSWALSSQHDQGLLDTFGSGLLKTEGTHGFTCI